MNRSREYVTSEVYKSEKKLLIKAIVITAAFFATYSIAFVIRVYEFSTKSHISLITDLIASVGICLNALLNSIVLLNYDGLVRSSALELLGLDKKWGRKESKSVKVELKKANHVVVLGNITNNESQNNGIHSMVTRKIQNSFDAKFPFSSYDDGDAKSPQPQFINPDFLDRVRDKLAKNDDDQEN